MWSPQPQLPGVGEMKTQQGSCGHHTGASGQSLCAPAPTVPSLQNLLRNVLVTDREKQAQQDTCPGHTARRWWPPHPLSRDDRRRKDNDGCHVPCARAVLGTSCG